MKTISILKIFSVAVNIVLLLVVAFIGYKLFAIDKYLPIDRVVTLDGNGVVYLYDTRIKVEENMIERDL